MEENLGTKIEDNKSDNKSQIISIISIMIGGLILLILLEELRNYLPDNLLDWNGVQVKTMGLLIAAVYIVISITITNYLNKLQSKLKEYQIAIYTGLILFMIECFFKLYQNIVFLDNGLDLEYIATLQIAIPIAVVGMLIANIAIHQLRKKGIQIPILLLIGVWFLIGFLMKST